MVSDGVNVDPTCRHGVFGVSPKRRIVSILKKFDLMHTQERFGAMTVEVSHKKKHTCQKRAVTMVLHTDSNHDSAMSVEVQTV